MSNTQFIWMNGSMIPWEQAQVHVLTHALHYGFGFFEGIRAYKTSTGRSAIFRLQDHIQRLFNSLKVGGLSIPYNQAEICQACIDVAIKNKLTDCYLRPIVYAGAGALGVNPINNPVQVAIAGWHWGTYLGNEALQKGIKTVISTFTRSSPNSALSHTKMTGSYGINVMAKMEATKRGAQEAILLDVDGYVAEGSVENIFIVSEGKLITPPRMAILPGITRHSVMTLAKELGYEVIEQRFTRDHLYICEEAFLTGTAAEITPIASVDDRAIGSGQRGPITQKLQEAYFKCLRGESFEHQDWLSYYELATESERLLV